MPTKLIVLSIQKKKKEDSSQETKIKVEEEISKSMKIFNYIYTCTLIELEMLVYHTISRIF